MLCYYVLGIRLVSSEADDMGALFHQVRFNLWPVVWAWRCAARCACGVVQ